MTENHRKLFPSFLILNNLPLLRGLVPERYSSKLVCERSPKTGGPIFIAVHGTWATRAKWNRSNSTLFAGLQRTWPESGFYRFEWSGVNGARHRLSAVMKLADELDDLLARYPTSKIVAISHSHGGNVVAWASTSIARALFAAVYLNTPFIQVLPPLRSHRWILRALLMLGMLYGAFPLGFLGAFSLVNFIAFMLGWIIVFLIVQHYVPIWVSRLSEALEDVSNVRRKIHRELVVNAVGDEAASVLGGIYIGQWLTRRVIKWLFCVLLVCSFSLALSPRLLQETRIFEIKGFVEYLILAILSVSASIAVCAYGLVHGLIGLDSPVSVSPAPLGRVDALTIGWKPEDQLRHSVLHQSVEVSAAIADWLEPILGYNMPKWL